MDINKFKNLLRYPYSLIPIKYRLHNSYFKIKNFLFDAQWWSKERILKWQLYKLKNIIQYAYDNCSGYNELYKNHNVEPKDLQKINDFNFFPFVTKELINDNINDFTSSDKKLGRKTYYSTGGSTGIQLGFYNTYEEICIETAFSHSGWERVGWKINDKIARLGGGYIGDIHDLFNYQPTTNEHHLSYYYLNDKTYSKYIKYLLKHKPKFLHSYPSAALSLSNLIIENNDIGSYSPSSILLGSENITDWQKKIIKKAFPSSKLFGWYGHTEKAVLAHWSEKKENYYIWPFYGYTEILKENLDQSAFGYGEIIATSFWMKSTPFIKYKTMDFGSLKRNDNSDKRNFDYFSFIDGRIQEFAISSTYRKISMTAINMHDDVFDDLKQFQFYQDKVGFLELKLVQRNSSNSINLNKIKKLVKKKLGEDIELEITIVDNILAKDNGKFSFIDQRLDLDKFVNK